MDGEESIITDHHTSFADADVALLDRYFQGSKRSWFSLVWLMGTPVNII